MLSQDEKNEISAEMARYEKKSAACIDALRIVQVHRGWVSDENVSDIAHFLGMSSADVDGVATFYNRIFRKPVGRRVLFVCDSVSCWVMGCSRVKARLRSELGVDLGQTTSDGLITLLPIACLGHCEAAPVLLIHGAGIEQPVVNVTEESLTQLIAQLREEDLRRSA